MADLRGLVKIVNLEFDDGDDVTQAEKLLRVGEAGERPGFVVVVEAGVEDAGDFEAHVLGHQAERSELALRAGDEDNGADGGAEIVGHFFAQDNGRIRFFGIAIVG